MIDMSRNKRHPFQERKKKLVVQYNEQADKVTLRSVTPKNVQQCLEGMGLDFSKYNQLKAYQQRERHLYILHGTDKLLRPLTSDLEKYLSFSLQFAGVRHYEQKLHYMNIIN